MPRNTTLVSRCSTLLLAITASTGAACSSSSSATSDTDAASRPDATPHVDASPHADAHPRADASSPAKHADGGSPKAHDAAKETSVVAPIGDDTGVQAVSAATFLGSIGVCVHVTQGVDDPMKSATAMAYAGIKNLRDDGSAGTVASWIAMYKQAGVRTNFLPVTDIPTEISIAKQLQAAGALLSIEGPNEPNNFPVTYGGETSSSTTFAPVADFQRDLYAAVRAEPTLAGVPVFHSSEAGGSEPDDVGLQFLTIPPDAGTTMPAGTAYADYANTHNYVCGHSNQLVDNTCWDAEDPTLNGDWDGLYVEYGHTWNQGFPGYPNPQLATLPRVTTETGWVTQGTGAITEEQQARIFLNLYLSAYKRGWSYTFVYMLRDDPVQGYWGFFDTSYAAKTSGTYLHNLTTLLADATAAPSGKLDYAIPNEPATVHDLLLQKSDGTFALAVWDEHPAGGTDTVTVSLTKPRSSVVVYDPTTGTTATQTVVNVSSVPLTLTDHPVILSVTL